MDKHEVSTVIFIYFAILILFRCSITCFHDTIWFYCVKQDESEENENSNEIKMQDLLFSGMFLIAAILMITIYFMVVNHMYALLY